jgi:hypothetical protein
MLRPLLTTELSCDFFDCEAPAELLLADGEAVVGAAAVGATVVAVTVVVLAVVALGAWGSFSAVRLLAACAL